MKATDIQRAQSTLGHRAEIKRIADRIVAGQSLHLTIGEPSDCSEIVLTAGIRKWLRETILTELYDEIDALDRNLAAMGVEL